MEVDFADQTLGCSSWTQLYYLKSRLTQRPEVPALNEDTKKNSSNLNFSMISVMSLEASWMLWNTGFFSQTQDNFIPISTPVCTLPACAFISPPGPIIPEISFLKAEKRGKWRRYVTTSAGHDFFVLFSHCFLAFCCRWNWNSGSAILLLYVFLEVSLFRRRTVPPCNFPFVALFSG